RRYAASDNKSCGCAVAGASAIGCHALRSSGNGLLEQACRLAMVLADERALRVSYALKRAEQLRSKRRWNALLGPLLATTAVYQ
ncbi:hypothetical protein, partial [Xanthomonas bromi]